MKENKETKRIMLETSEPPLCSWPAGGKGDSMMRFQPECEGPRTGRADGVNSNTNIRAQWLGKTRVPKRERGQESRSESQRFGKPSFPSGKESARELNNKCQRATV